MGEGRKKDPEQSKHCGINCIWSLLYKGVDLIILKRLFCYHLKDLVFRYWQMDCR